ncbi:MAG: alpha/beta hydrolase-fold protein [Dehalococcoidia bacterium]|nr:alpha/beta hydrolase-fold protein [Dehalococcoidia bacterium]
MPTSRPGAGVALGICMSLVGTSMGGLISMHTAARHPEHVEQAGARRGHRTGDRPKRPGPDPGDGCERAGRLRRPEGGGEVLPGEQRAGARAAVGGRHH